MDVNSVNKPVVQPVPAQKRQTEARQASAEQNKPKMAETNKVNEVKPKPVVNTQGQVTGRHLNVTA